jgi:RHS repeat-associated protein
VRFKTAAHALTKQVEYEYDVQDRRTVKRVDGNGDLTYETTFYYLYDEQDIVSVYNGSGSLTNRYLHGPAVDQILADENAIGDVLFPLADNQGTVRDIAEHDALTDTTSIVKHLAYSAFGAITHDTAPTLTFLYAYTGREWDADAGLYYYRARWYDPHTGRFLSRDPIGFTAGDANDLRYVGNSPANYVDPTGLEIAGPGFNPYGNPEHDRAMQYVMRAFYLSVISKLQAMHENHPYYDAMNLGYLFQQLTIAGSRVGFRSCVGDPWYSPFWNIMSIQMDNSAHYYGAVLHEGVHAVDDFLDINFNWTNTYLGFFESQGLDEAEGLAYLIEALIRPVNSLASELQKFEQMVVSGKFSPFELQREWLLIWGNYRVGSIRVMIPNRPSRYANPSDLACMENRLHVRLDWLRLTEVYTQFLQHHGHEFSLPVPSPETFDEYQQEHFEFNR